MGDKQEPYTLIYKKPRTCQTGYAHNLKIEGYFIKCKYPAGDAGFAPVPVFSPGKWRFQNLGFWRS
jgi:hypothetical protein